MIIFLLSEVCKKSKPFNEYLNNNRINLLYVVLYEVNEFFNHNRHYESLNIKRVDSLIHIIKKFDDLLIAFQKDKLNKTEKELLSSYLDAIALGKMSVIHNAIAFYKEQKMVSYVALAQKN
jgi:hypothetical protein